MRKIPIVHHINNLEVLTKLLNSVARKYGCHVEYIADENRLRFIGDHACCRHIAEETLALFQRTSDPAGFPLKCPLDG